MAKAGDSIESPLSGVRIVFLKTARDTNGQLLQIDDVMQGGGRVPIEHVHPYMEERFEILSGSARLSMRGQERNVGAGETVVVPAGTPHVWGNPNADDVHLILEFRPALRMEDRSEVRRIRLMTLHKRQGEEGPKRWTNQPQRRCSSGSSHL